MPNSIVTSDYLTTMSMDGMWMTMYMPTTYTATAAENTETEESSASSTYQSTKEESVTSEVASRSSTYQADEASSTSVTTSTSASSSSIASTSYSGAVSVYSGVGNKITVGAGTCLLGLAAVLL